MNRATERLLRALIREEIGHNFRTRDNDPYQYWETVASDFQIYPTDDGYCVDIKIDGRPDLNSYLRVFPTEAEAEHFARQHIEYVRKALNSDASSP